MESWLPQPSVPPSVRLSQSKCTSPSGGEDERTRAPETASSCMSSCCAQTQIRFKRRARGSVNRKDDKRGTPSSSPYAHCPPIHLILKTHLDKRARRPFLEFPQIPNPLRCPILFASLPEAPCLFQEPFCRLLALPASQDRQLCRRRHRAAIRSPFRPLWWRLHGRTCTSLLSLDFCGCSFQNSRSLASE